jgi:exonuclease III
MCLKNKEPLLIGGDFNIMRFFDEKNKPFLPNKFSRLFNSVIHLNELREVYIGGDQFTWINNQKHPTLEKLDRIMMTNEWEKLFPTIQAFKAPREISDHNPIIMATR